MPTLHGDRRRPLLMRAELPSAKDQLLRRFARRTRDAALGGHTGLAHRMPPAIGSAFAAAQRVIDRVHRLGARVRADAHVTRTAGFADAHVDPIEIAKLSNSRPAGAADAAHFARGQN